MPLHRKYKIIVCIYEIKYRKKFIVDDNRIKFKEYKDRNNILNTM